MAEMVLTTEQVGVIREAVSRGRAHNLEHVEMTVSRHLGPKGSRPPAKVRMFGRGGPWSSEDRKVEVLDAPNLVKAWWRVADLEIVLRNLERASQPKPAGRRRGPKPRV